jgi:hypothetical protein
VIGSQGKFKGSQGKLREVNSAERVMCASRTIRSKREAVSEVRTESGVLHVSYAEKCLCLRCYNNIANESYNDLTCASTRLMVKLTGSCF